jgi:hypothetical protein
MTRHRRYEAMTVPNALSLMPGARSAVAMLLALGVWTSVAASQSTPQPPAQPSPPPASPAPPSATQPAAATASATPPPVPRADPRVVSRSTPHLTFTGTISHAAVAPGAKMSISFDVVPKKGMHVFAPGTHYRPVAIRLDTGSLLRVHGSIYPKPAHFLFKPLKEDVLVYDAPFRLAITVVAGDAEALRAQLRGQSQMTVKGAFDYQACDDSVCYSPASVPFQWTLRVTRR